MNKQTLIVTGCAGFIGSHFVDLVLSHGYRVVGIDAMTYAGKTANMKTFADHPDFKFYQMKIQDSEVLNVLTQETPIALINFAAESHVDRSITGARAFVETNVLGVQNLIDVTREYLGDSHAATQAFRFLQVSTDEVFGALGESGFFSESTPYAPNSPYSASKAGGDLLVRAAVHTHQFPAIVTHCSNNYGPRQDSEKLIPHMVTCALQGKPLPVYGQGQNVRDWIHVKDHCSGVFLALTRGKTGETYALGGRSERKNVDVVHRICEELDYAQPKKMGSYRDQIQFVTDRKGHDYRYAIDDRKAEQELGFTRNYANFEQGLKNTIYEMLSF